MYIKDRSVKKVEISMLDSIKAVLPSGIKCCLKLILHAFRWDPWQQSSWSQEGEDQILRRIFEGKSIGFYVDVGAHHPKRFSNTYFFYRLGWSGINIDAMPNSMKEFRKERPRDINVEIGVGSNVSEMNYYVFNDPALNSFSKLISEERDESNNPYKIIDIKVVKIESLENILDMYLPENQKIDFLSIDVEGMDLDVLKSNNWKKYRPEYVLVEILGSSLHDIEHRSVSRFLIENGYSVYAKCVNTVFFKKGIDDDARGTVESA
jgi:FkbM family methyltransferase